MVDKVNALITVIPAYTYRDVGGRATHDYMDIGGRVTPGAVTEEAKADAEKWCVDEPFMNQRMKIQLNNVSPER